ncbi:radical SAM protein [Oceanicella actignis]|uniref:4Fe-4S single cluster domain-containing protein n=1 Tax=Oceanicella actignis TaxID=1189325 RepID=A0A1M7RWC9_9RHOB|nr:radical SAM protein [Oceanicella actignis]SES99423.1 Radical SAM superfamily protein [Oceanicella actignis]SHN50677.1 4Fe-4S single cluster domain-containing protein [Oceanicella actignis]
MKDHAAGPAPGKFVDPELALSGRPRARVAPVGLETLWFNTGTLCNIECLRCYIESSPTNDALVYLTEAEVRAYLDEAEALGLELREVGFTGGEPFMAPEIIGMIGAALERGREALVLTNAMRPMMRPRVQAGIRRLAAAHGARLTLRVSLDHHEARHHDEERGAGAFEIALAGLRWLREAGVRTAVAGRTLWGEDERDARAGYAALFAREGLDIDAWDPARLVLFPEMDEGGDPPEITEDCWAILNKRPEEVMCASSRMVVRRKGADGPSVVACTLLPYDARFELGRTLAEALRPVPLNHPHCATFCVLGGGSCSA